MGKRSRDKAERQFDEKIVVRRYLEMIDMVSKPSLAAAVEPI